MVQVLILKEHGCTLITDELWKIHCKKKFGTKEDSFDRYNVRSWKELYKVCEEYFFSRLTDMEIEKKFYYEKQIGEGKSNA